MVTGFGRPVEPDVWTIMKGSEAAVSKFFLYAYLVNEPSASNSSSVATAK